MKKQQTKKHLKAKGFHLTQTTSWADGRITKDHKDLTSENVGSHPCSNLISSLTSTAILAFIGTITGSVHL